MNHYYMKTIKLICPYCGAPLSIENGLDSFYCQYCGGKILLTGQDESTINAKVQLKKFEHQERLQQNQYAFQERVQKSNQAYKLKKREDRSSVIKNVIEAILIIVFAVFLIIFALITKD